ncbi:MAG: hypothetical protein B7Y56_02995 [Gallionellales bacterium 35-53-114]|jgi:hypothetical protein|nr:MAG: hypothetical protein B7Y56_02995 [Gallionellales bacterium 35-53-114]OYZ65074.1 MAG: hypothetical protein B7Y04_00155 [Gallionellales bacterium 24-53-125]OZB07983.1 MAG: hypothetical protein B7X61_10605 [Gallionellales bacterium 39-52-133]HQS59723.1 hypothetical protein [Gallionellaceae bacterium]HQS76477.1 hypothetical protein [Gallionellaceae bacterium]
MTLSKPSLADYITGKLSQPFEYGVNDCILFTIGWVEIATGKKYLPAKLWKNEKEALRLIKKHGGLIAVFDKHYTRIEPNYARDGDLTIVDGIAYLFSGVSIVSVGQSGLLNKSRIIATTAWTFSHG